MPPAVRRGRDLSASGQRPRRRSCRRRFDVSNVRDLSASRPPVGTSGSGATVPACQACRRPPSGERLRPVGNVRAAGHAATLPICPPAVRRGERPRSVGLCAAVRPATPSATSMDGQRFDRLRRRPMSADSARRVRNRWPCARVPPRPFDCHPPRLDGNAPKAALQAVRRPPVSAPV